MRGAFALIVVLGAAVEASGQSIGCDDAFDTLARVNERIFSADSKAALEELHHIIKARTGDCEDLVDLWQMREKLARMIGNEDDAGLSKKRAGVTTFAVTAREIQAARRSDGFDPAGAVRKRWALVAGTATYRTANALRPLEYAEQDFARMGALLSKTLGFDDVRTLTGEAFTRDGFRSEIARLRDEVAKDDLVVVYLLGHGYPTREDPNSTSFILTYDSEVGSARQRYVSALQVVDVVQELYREIPAQRVLLLLDTCYSGDAITGQKDYAGHPAPQLLDAFTRGSGRAVIAAASASQRSWELEAKGQGAFVYCLDKVVGESAGAPLGELFAALQACVDTSVRETLGPGYPQQPVLFASDGARGVVLGRPR